MIGVSYSTVSPRLCSHKERFPHPPPPGGLGPGAPAGGQRKDHRNIASLGVESNRCGGFRKIDVRDSWNT